MRRLPAVRSVAAKHRRPPPSSPVVLYPFTVLACPAFHDGGSHAAPGRTQSASPARRGLSPRPAAPGFTARAGCDRLSRRGGAARLAPPLAALQRLPPRRACRCPLAARSEEHTSELQSLMRISYAVFCLKKKTQTQSNQTTIHYSST